jgi:hypothetical protein
MLFNKPLGTHIINFPSGRWGFVGSLPLTLGELAEASTADVMGGRAWRDDATGQLVAPRFPSFATEPEARAHAAARGVALAN